MHLNRGHSFGRKNAKPTWIRRSVPSKFRRARVRAIRNLENHHLANCIANDRLESYEPLGLTRRDALHLYL